MFVVGLFIVPSAEFIFFASDSLNCAASIVRARYYTNQIQSDCFEYPLKFLLKSRHQKCLNIFLIFSKFSYPQRKPVMKNFKTKKKSLYHLSNFNSRKTVLIACFLRGHLNLLFSLFYVHFL